MKLKTLITLFAALIFVSACSSSSESDPKPTEKPEATPTPPTGNPDKGELGITMGDLEQDRWTETTPLKLRDTMVVVETTFKASNDPWYGYSGADVIVDWEPLYTAFAMSESQFEEALMEGNISFAAIEPGGNVVTEATANGYGYWFDAAGKVCQHGRNSVIAVETEDFRTYSVMQYPGAVKSGEKYTVCLGLFYEVEGVTYRATIQIDVNIMKEYTAADYEVAGTVKYDINISKEGGYNGESFMVDEDEICGYLGLTVNEFGNKLGSTCTLVPLNADGTDGDNTAGGDFGGWFDTRGTVGWGNGDLTYIEISARNPFYFSTGCHASHVSVGDEVTMNMQYRNMENLKACNVVVNATITQ